MTNLSDLDTADMPIVSDPPGAPPRPFSSRTHVDASGLSHTGKVRPNNEDHFIVARVGRSMHTLMSNLPEGEIPARFDEAGQVMMVADGMGGAAGGEVASSMAISTLVNIVLDVPDWIMKLDDERARELMDRAVGYYQQVDAALAERAQAQPELAGMGTTMTVAYSVGTDLFIAHVGDSRVYVFRDANLQQLTRDHTHAQVMVDAGVIKREEVATHRLRNVLTNALGAGDREVDVDFHRLGLASGDRLLLCTDGLTEMVPDDEIATILAQGKQPDETCRDLVDRALERGGKDNVTVVVADYSFPS
jgi:protein phosphatase